MRLVPLAPRGFRQVIAMMSSDDDAAAAYYEDPASREFAGPARRRRVRQGRLTEHVPIRFAAETIEKVQLLADENGPDSQRLDP